TVWIGVALQGTVRVRCYHLDGDRKQIRASSVDAALEMLHSLLVSGS
ncbi:MAG: CDP-diacylglycerol--glycerol-3-phosphate 3-phosphatidyltransferase, partial [Gammaproteobacteria bacterium]|nr:CinA family protein [Gemmatimonadota bacterium]NIT88729.1 CinA family protein [Gemmatimonadota bacterium]NIU75637.1 CDP-diacylglycerol--glycerol-3-phosphate 3-phosphatidyltransferase [Gammaproteobacteria bacterium]NIX40935.1 CDP-diacylglycerol--glycerol-3-phosphate 3-phosphatidyltransferase [Gemmatimonadota bacterium]